MKNDAMTDIGKISKQILELKISNKAVEELKEEFYQIMKQNDVHRYTKDADGVETCDSFEWTMCKTLLLDVVARQVEWSMLIDDL